MPARSHPRWPRLFGPRPVLPIVLLLGALAAGAGGPYLRWGNPAGRAAPARLPALTVDPASGPAGSTVSLSLTGYFSSGIVTATIAFDTQNGPVGTVQLVPCTVGAVPGAAPSYGFGLACIGQAQTETVPAGAQLGAHVFIVLNDANGVRVPFQVTAPATVTSTVTSSPTAMATATPSVTATTVPSASATTVPSASAVPTGIATPSATVSATPSQTATGIATGTPAGPTLTPTSTAIGPTATASLTPILLATAPPKGTSPSPTPTVVPDKPSPIVAPRSTTGEGWPRFHLDNAGTGANTFEHSLSPGSAGSLHRIWRAATKGQVRSAPVVVGGLTFVASFDGRLYAFDSRTGVPKWAFAYATCAPACGVYSAAAPAVVGGLVILPASNGHVYAVDAATGTGRWVFSGGGSGLSSTAFAEIKGRQGAIMAVFVGTPGGIWALDAKSGRPLWRRPSLAPVSSAIAVDRGTVFAGDDAGNVYALDAATGAVHWIAGGLPCASPPKGKGLQATAAPRACPCGTRAGPTVAGDRVVAGSTAGTVYALDRATGKLLWRYQTRGAVVSSPAVGPSDPAKPGTYATGGLVFAGSADHYLYALDLASGAPRWRYQTGGPISSSPAYANGVVLAGSLDGRLYAVAAATGKPLWSEATGGPIDLSSPAILDGRVFIGSRDGGLYAYQVKV